jgi:hypothetical protein
VSRPAVLICGRLAVFGRKWDQRLINHFLTKWDMAKDDWFTFRKAEEATIRRAYRQIHYGRVFAIAGMVIAPWLVIAAGIYLAFRGL